MPRISKHPYLKQHHNTWQFRYRLPADVRHAFDGKHEYIKSLKTEDVREAERRKQQHLDLVVNRIKAVRTGDDSSFMNAALYWRGVLKGAADSEGAYDHFQDAALDEAVSTYINGGWKTVYQTAGTDPDQYEAIKRSPQGERVLKFMGVATGEKVPTTSFIDQWYAAYEVQPKTKDMAKSEVIRFAKEHPYLNQITKKAVTQWLEKRKAEGTATSTLRRSLTSLHQYWQHLQRHEEVAEEYNPFAGHRLKKKNGGHTDVLAFTPNEVALILKAIDAKPDDTLKQLTVIAAYTGMKIEEICAMKVENVTASMLSVVDAKTVSGIRELPIHSKLKPLIKRLKSNSPDGYLISGLSADKYGDRSAAVGKRFGYLKANLGYTSRSHTFHSLRHTFSTALLRADVSPVVTDFLMGHKSGNLAIDTYSDGVSFKQKKDAVAKIKYPATVSKYAK